MAERKILGKEFLDWLKSQEIIPQRTRRVVIDASVDSVVRIYTEQFGTEQLTEGDAPPEIKGAIVVEMLPKGAKNQ